MVENAQILLVEDEPNFGTVLKSYLQLANYKVDWCKNGKEAYSKLKVNQYQLCILDVMMPEMDGFTLGKEIKISNIDTPFIFLTAKGLKEDILKGFKIGAEDYLTKPFDSDILLEKIKVILDRNSLSNNTNYLQEKIAISTYTFLPKTRKLISSDFEKKLSPKESALLIELIKHKDSILLRSFALKSIWKDDNYFTARSMDVYIAKLRKYFSQDQSIQIETIHGKGLTFNYPA